MTRLTSVEHDLFWYEHLLKRLKENGNNNVELFLMENDSYVFLIDRFPDGSLDFVLVDGGPRNICAIKAIQKIKLGGILILDNANLYLPSNTNAPNSKSKHTGPSTFLECERIKEYSWSLFLDKVGKWRNIWTSDGVTDDTIWIKNN